MGSLWIYRYRPMRLFLTISTTLFIGVPLTAQTLVRSSERVNSKNGENVVWGVFLATLFQRSLPSGSNVSTDSDVHSDKFRNLTSKKHHMSD